MQKPTNQFDAASLIFLMMAGVAERFIYYGFRSIFILYLVSNDGGFGLSDMDASANYQLMVIAIIVSLMIAGPLLDFVIPKKLSLPLSYLLMSIGLVLCVSSSLNMLTAGIIFIGVGSALVRVSFFTKLDSAMKQIPKRRNLAFIAFACASSVFIFLAPITVGELAINYSFNTAIQTIAFLCLLPLALSFLIKIKPTTTKPATEILKTPQRLGLVALAILLSIGFWLVYDLHSNSLFNQVMVSFDETTAAISQFTQNTFFSMSAIILIIMSVIFMIVLALFPKIPVLKTLALATILMPLSYTIFYRIAPVDVGMPQDIFNILTILILSGIAETMFVPLLNAYVLKRAPEKFKATLFSIFLLTFSSLTFLSTVLQENMTDFTIILLSLPATFIIVAMIFVEKQVIRRNTNPVFPPQHLQE